MPAFREKKLYNVWFFLGLLCVGVMAVPYVILGQDSIVTYHDQLDGELIAYILRARHLFDGNVIPEFMNGADKTALTMPAPGFVLLFCMGNALGALVAMQMAGSLCGYVGMYLLAREVSAARFVAMASGIMYAYLPFLPVYGLSQYGLPLLLWCFLQMRKGRHRKAAFVYGALYALCSSLVLVGFGVLLAGGIWVCMTWKRRGRWLSLGVLGMMLGIYVLENIRLLGQMFGAGNAGLSHKAEYVLTPEPFAAGLIQGFVHGGQHSQAFQLWILAAALLWGALALALRAWKKEEQKRLLKVMGICLLVNFLLAFVSALWNSSPGILVREKLGAAGAFQAQRLLWMAPCLWYLLLVCTAQLAWGIFDGERRKRKASGGWGHFSLALKGMGLLCLGAAAAATGIQILMGSNLKPNIQKLRNPDYGLLSFRDYYAVGVMDQAEAYIREETGMEPEQYRVVSLGIDPAAALYQGFYCLDGYSNNYSLEYKHAFRKAIAPELVKSPYLQDYYDNWGNRCYLFSAECPGYYTIEKNGFYFQDYSLDTEALRQLGGTYLLSAAWIMNAEEEGLTLLREEPFETQDSYYRIFIYKY
nr:DUF6044 family protein [uncultured Acetatifactor sp.]